MPERDPTSIDTYLRIGLDTEPLNDGRLDTALRRLHSLGADSRLDVRLVATDRLEYYVGSADTHASTVEHTLRSLFPEGTQLDRETPPSLPEEPTAALELYSRSERRGDWQTRLEPVTAEKTTHTRFPLAAVVDALADTDATVHYQALLTPKPDWGADASLRIDKLTRNRDTPAQRFIDFLFDEYTVDPSVEDADPTHQRRIRSIQATDPSHSFAVCARAVASGDGAEATLEEFGTALRSADGPFYQIGRAHV